MRRSLLLSIITLIIITTNPQIYNQTVAIQNTNQTFFSYVPLSQLCNYSQANISQGGVQYTELDPQTIYQSLELANNIIFWGAIRNGMSMYLLSNQLLMNGTYSQIILYNSSVSSDFSSRSFILMQINQQGNTIFTYALPIFTPPNTLTPQILSQWNSTFPNNIADVISECNSNNSIRFVFIGNFAYVGYCLNTTTLFAWNISNPNQTIIYPPLPILNNSLIYNITSNPDNMLPSISINNYSIPLQQPYNYQWNAALYLSNTPTTIFCVFTFVNCSCQDYQNEQLWLQVVANRAWGLQSIIQETDLEFVLSSFPNIVNLDFPGSIVSVFTSQQTIFIESQSNNTNYLIIFDNGLLLTNLTIPGQVIYYGQQKIILQTPNGSFIQVNFILPMLNIPNQSQQPNTSLTLNCGTTQYQYQFQILWTDINFPSAIVIQLNNSFMQSTQNIFTFDLNSRYQVIGPAFDVFIAQSQNLQITLLDASLVVLTDSILALIDLVYMQSSQKFKIPYYILYITHLAQIKKYIFGTGNTQLLLSSPCGINSFIDTLTLDQGFVLMTQSGGCFCDKLINCYRVTTNEIATIITSNYANTEDYLSAMQNIQNIYNPHLPPSQTDNSSTIKKQLFGVVGSDQVINIYTNNSIILLTLEGQQLDFIQSDCTIFNSTQGLTFTRNFYDDFLILYCYNSPYISQYILRNQQLIFNRIIPLYGFITKGPNSTSVAGTNYIFMEVELNPNIVGTYVFNTQIQNCCILRIDPNTFTVSAIAQIIKAQYIIFVSSIFGVDIVYYNMSNVNSPNTYLKIYYDSSWISFDQQIICTPANTTCTPITYQYTLAFNSPLYNFAACFFNQITFNISASLLTTNDPNLQDVEMQLINGPTTYYYAHKDFNFNSICGPIAYYNQIGSYVNPFNIFTVVTNNILTSNKFIFSSSAILQILDLGIFLPNTTLASLMLMVTESSLSFYSKYDQMWLSFISTVNASQLNCMYFLYSNSDNYTAQFGTDCYNTHIPTPLITVVYNPDFPINICLNVTFDTMVLSQQLRNIQTLLLEGMTGPLVFGLGQGPSKSISGVLFICSNVCNSLVITTKVVFFIDYQVQQYSDGFTVAALDLQKISIWMNPSVPVTSGVSVIADYVVDYSTILGFSCSKIQIVTCSSQQLSIILSCSKSYIQLIIAIPSLTLTFGDTFDKFSNCEQIDKFKPIFSTSPDSSNLTIMVVQCEQSIGTIRLLQFQSINSSSTSIITAYMQIYTKSGPSCSPNRWSPIRILPIATSMDFMLYTLYQANNQLKLIYEQIDGTLIDAFVITNPFADYSLIQLTKEKNFPTVSFQITNSYYQLIFTIVTEPQKIAVPEIYVYVMYGVFAFTNIITLIFLICWLIFVRKKRRNRHGVDFTTRNFNTSYFNSPRSNQPQSLSISHQTESSATASIRQPSIVRKVTEIELFQPRYKQNVQK